MYEKLWAILKNEFSEYKEWNKLLDEKKQAVFDENLDYIKTIVEKEKKISINIKNLEKERESIIKELEKEQKASLTFSDIFPDKSEWLSEFKSLIKEASFKNEQVMMLSKYMLNYHRSFIESIHKAINNLTYSPDNNNRNGSQIFNLIDFKA